VLKRISPLMLCIACALVFGACSKSDTTANGNGSATTVNTNKSTTTTTTTSSPTTTSSTTTTTTPASGDKVGVPECDEYIAKFETCVSGKVPEAARAQYEASLKQLRDSWRAAASTPQGKAGLAQGCKMVTDQARQSMKAYGCDF
jgi:hypothetical protein